MRCFENIAKLIRTRRINHPKGYSQSELSHLLGYKNGQFISNVERALCNVPLKMLKKVSDILDISGDELKSAILKDHDVTLDNHLKAAKSLEEEHMSSSEASQGDTQSMSAQRQYSFKTAFGE